MSATIAEEAIADTFRSENRVYITKLKPSTKVEIPIERITFRKLVADKCGQVKFTSSTMPSFVTINNEEFIPKNLPILPEKICSKKLAKSDASYRTSETEFVLAGMPVNKALRIMIIKPAIKNIKTNKCGIGWMPLPEVLTPFADSYEINLYSINKVKVQSLAKKPKPKC
jgi:hypothetical protein